MRGRRRVNRKSKFQNHPIICTNEWVHALSIQIMCKYWVWIWIKPSSSQLTDDDSARKDKFQSIFDFLNHSNFNSSVLSLDSRTLLIVENDSITHSKWVESSRERLRTSNLIEKRRCHIYRFLGIYEMHENVRLSPATMNMLCKLSSRIFTCSRLFSNEFSFPNTRQSNFSSCKLSTRFLNSRGIIKLLDGAIEKVYR